MGLHRADAEHEAPGDLGVGASLGEQREDLLLTIAELEEEADGSLGPQVDAARPVAHLPRAVTAQRLEQLRGLALRQLGAREADREREQPCLLAGERGDQRRAADLQRRDPQQLAQLVLGDAG